MPELRFADELERKTLEACERLALRHDQGVISSRELKIAMQAIWDCTSGLVDQIQDIMDGVREIVPEDEPIRHVAVRGIAAFVVERKGATVGLISMNASGGPERCGEETFDTEVEAVEAVNKKIKRFEREGYRIA